MLDNERSKSRTFKFKNFETTLPIYAASHSRRHQSSGFFNHYTSSTYGTRCDSLWPLLFTKTQVNFTSNVFWRHRGAVEVWLYSMLASAIRGRGSRPRPTRLPQAKSPHPHFRGGWLYARACLYLQKKKSLFPPELEPHTLQSITDD